MRTTRLAVAAALVAAAAPLAFAVSDGNYDYRRQHCSGAADNTDPGTAENGCHALVFAVRDNGPDGGHEYFGWGIQQIGEDDPNQDPFGFYGGLQHQVDVWYDGGQGCTRYTEDYTSPGAPAETDCLWWTDASAPNYEGPNPPPHPETGLYIYMGADDNLDGGEHDSSRYVSNGPSDGGALHIAADPGSVIAFVTNVMNSDYVLKHPLPAGDFGFGTCVDGICFSIQTQEQRAMQAGNGTTPNGHTRHVANYENKTFDPETCESEPGKDDPAHCGGTTIDGQEESDTPMVEPGVQIYEDPDAQASPVDPYPQPAIYVGTCGVILGSDRDVDSVGGFPFDSVPLPATIPAHFPGAPGTNGKGQVVISTCQFD
jgi:hypothetical protein